MDTTTYTTVEAEAIDEHVGDFNKDNDRNPDRGELFEMMRERMEETEESPLHSLFVSIVDKMAAERNN